MEWFRSLIGVDGVGPLWAKVLAWVLVVGFVVVQVMRA